MVDWDLGHEDVVKNAPRWEGFEWLRPNEISELSGEGLKLFDKIEPNDILQGGLGDCYFMCCLSTIAEWPERIQRMFTNKTISPNGVYGVRLYRNGEPLTVFVDDNIVCDSGRVAFASAKGQELWTILIEKAFAKSFGSFLRIIGGWPADTLRDLTGAPTEVYDNKEHDADKMFEIIYDGEVKDYMMCASKNQSDGPKAAGGESLDE